MTITSIVFDIGNVLLPFDFDPATEKILSKSTRKSAEDVAAVTAMKEELEDGSMDEAQFFGRLRDQLDYKGSDEELEGAWVDIFSPNRPMWEFVESFAGRIPLYLLSNTNAPHVRHMFRSYPVFAHFEGSVYSHEAKCAKPDEKIYRIAETRFDLVPETTLYIDDLKENVETPRQMGWNAIQYDFKDHEAFLEQVDSMGIR
ncbi:MAG: HAD family phosphatase [Verrucomicrobiota bacterium]